MLYMLKLRPLNITRACRIATNRIATGTDKRAVIKVVEYTGQVEIEGYEVVPMSEFIEADKKHSIGFDKDAMKIEGSAMLKMLSAEPDVIVISGCHSGLADVLYCNKCNGTAVPKEYLDEDQALDTAILDNTRHANSASFKTQETNRIGLIAWTTNRIGSYSELMQGEFGFNNGQKICASCVIRLVTDRNMDAEKAIQLAQKPLQELVKITDDVKLLEKFEFYTSGGKPISVLNKKQMAEAGEVAGSDLTRAFFDGYENGSLNLVKTTVKAIDEKFNSLNARILQLEDKLTESL